MKNSGRNIKTIISLLIVMLSNIIVQIIPNLSLDKHIKIVLLITITCCSVLFGFAPLFYFFTIGGQKWIIEQFVPVVFNALFQERINTLKHDENKNKEYLLDCVYRVSYYQYYDSKSLSLKFHRLARELKIWKYPPSRKIPKNKDILLCKYRYGLEKGVYTTVPSTIVYAIEENNDKSNPLDKVKGVAGLIAKNDKSTFFCIDNTNINEVLEKLRCVGILTNEKEKDTISGSIKLMENHLSNYQSICNNDSSKPEISSQEQTELLDFMKNTHTDYNAMFDISGGKHSNHFLGFKVYDNLHNIKGVVVIDAREHSNQVTFNEIVHGKKKEDWLKNVLQVFSGTTSKSMSIILQERENENGKRIRD